MNEKTKYLTALILAVVVSAATSYIVTLSLPTPIVEALVEQEVAKQLSPNKVNLPYEVSFFAAGHSLVTIYSKTTVENLTIVYKYKILEDETMATTSVEYGTFIPAWGAGAVIEAGAVPEALYKIPNDIIQACSTTKTNEHGNIVFDIPPQLEIIEVYGYSQK